MEIMLKNKCCLYVIISIRFFSITICNLLIEFPLYIEEARCLKVNDYKDQYDVIFVLYILYCFTSNKKNRLCLALRRYTCAE